MGTIELKTNLHALIDQIQEFDVLEAIYVLLSKQLHSTPVQESDFADEMPETLKQEIQLSIEEADNNELIAHDVVMKKYEKWLSK